MKNQNFYKNPIMDSDIPYCARFALSELKSKHSYVNSRFSELAVIHLFLTKNDVDYAMNNSFSSISSDAKLNKQKMFPELPKFLAVRNALFLVYCIKSFNIPIERHFSNVLIKDIKVKTPSLNPLFEYDDSEDFNRKLYVLGKYLKPLYFGDEILSYLMARLSSYYLELYKRYESFEILNKKTTKSKFFGREKEFKSANRLYHLIFNAKSRNIEKNVCSSYSLLTEMKSEKNNELSLKYYFKENNRIYYRLIWEKYKKPIFFKHCPKFYNALFTLTNSISGYLVEFSNDINLKSETNKFLIYVSIDAVFSEKIKLEINK